MLGARTHPRLPPISRFGGVRSVGVASTVTAHRGRLACRCTSPGQSFGGSASARAIKELAQFIEGHINRVASGRIRDLHVVYSDDKIILQGRSRTYHAKQLAHQAVLDLTDGHPLLANQIVVS